MIRETTEEILCDTDWGALAEMYEVLGHEWVGPHGRHIPTAGLLRAHAASLLGSVGPSNHYSSSGGIEVHYGTFAGTVGYLMAYSPMIPTTP